MTRCLWSVLQIPIYYTSEIHRCYGLMSASSGSMGVPPPLPSGVVISSTLGMSRVERNHRCLWGVLSMPPGLGALTLMMGHFSGSTIHRCLWVFADG